MSKYVTTTSPIHPGEILRDEFLEPMGVSANRFAKHIGVPTNRITSIINGSRGITGDTALRFSQALNTTPEFWINLQSHYELCIAKQNADFNFGQLKLKSA